MKIKMLCAALSLSFLAGCNNPASVGAGTTERDALTRAEAINSAKTMAKSKDYSVTVEVKPYGILSRVMPAVVYALCDNDFIKKAEVTYEKSIYNFELAGDWRIVASSEIEAHKDILKSDYGVGRQFIEYGIEQYKEIKNTSDQKRIDFFSEHLEGGFWNESYKMVDKCHFAGLVTYATEGEGGWPRVAVANEEEHGRYRFMRLKLVQSYLASKHFFILSQAIGAMKSPEYEDVLEIAFAYFNDIEVVNEALLDASLFAAAKRVYTADRTGVEGVRFYTSDGYVYVTEKGSPSLMYMGSVWFNQDYVEGNAISYTTSMGSSATMMKQSVSKVENIRGAINEVAAKVGI